MNDCIFCKIIKGELPCTKVYEDDNTLAFLDINPGNKGHTLIIPKEHYETIDETPEKVLEKIIVTVKKIAKAIAKMADGYNLISNNKRVSGQLVPHLHFHIIPRYKEDGHNFSITKTKYEEKEIEKVAEEIKSLL